MISQQAIQGGPAFNEAEVRQHIINPALDRLGYRYGTPGVYIRLEDKLETPRLYRIGRASKKDFPLGFPDYRCGLSEGRGSFVVEAKAGPVKLTEAEVGQAHSYAAHAEVGANYFALFNGSEVRVYETLNGPDTAPLLCVPLGELNARFHELESVLAPPYLRKNCAVRYDMGLKLGQGLGSRVSIRSGEYTVEDYAYRIFMNGTDVTEIAKAHDPRLAGLDGNLKLMQDEFTLRISEGFVERDERGRIVASLSFPGVTKSNGVAMKIMGINDLSLGTNDPSISSDPDLPTTFAAAKAFSVSEGTEMPQFLAPPAVIAGDMSGEMLVRAFMHYEGSDVRGTYVAFTHYNAPPFMGQRTHMELDLAGTFTLRGDQ